MTPGFTKAYCVPDCHFLNFSGALIKEVEWKRSSIHLLKNIFLVPTLSLVPRIQERKRHRTEMVSSTVGKTVSKQTTI